MVTFLDKIKKKQVKIKSKSWVMLYFLYCLQIQTYFKYKINNTDMPEVYKYLLTLMGNGICVSTPTQTHVHTKGFFKEWKVGWGIKTRHHILKLKKRTIYLKDYFVGIILILPAHVILLYLYIMYCMR